MSLSLVGYSSSSSDSECDGASEADFVTRKRCIDHAEPDDASKRVKIQPNPVEDATNGKAKVTEDLAGNSKKLPLPSNITSMFADKDDGKGLEDKNLHGGRTRQFKHERGNWATSLYIPFEPSESFHSFLNEVLKCVQPSLGELNLVDDFHISVSRTFPVRHHWIDPLTSSLRDRIQGVFGFPCDFQDFQFYVNDDQSRSFLGLNVTGYVENMKSLVHVVDESLKEFRLPVYYKDPLFHMSLAWTLGDVRSSVTDEIMDKLRSLVHSYLDTGGLFPFMAEQVRCKIGNKCFDFKMASR